MYLGFGYKFFECCFNFKLNPYYRLPIQKILFEVISSIPDHKGREYTSFGILKCLVFSIVLFRGYIRNVKTSSLMGNCFEKTNIPLKCFLFENYVSSDK